MNRILIVDDEQHIREGISAKIEQCGDLALLVSGDVSNGAQALDWLDAHYADICITDIRMPVMDGLELIGRLKAKYPRMQCIIVSSYDDFDYAKQAIQLGATDYILKPIEREVLEASLQEVCRKLKDRRLDRAYQILANKMHASQQLIGRWKDLLVTRQFDKYPLLIMDTLKMMEEWVQQDYYLFDALSATWIEMVATELQRPKPEWTPVLDQELGFDMKTLQRNNERFYFRLVAVMRMEKAILYLIDLFKHGQQQENVKLVNQVKQYIERHYAEKVNLEELADLIPISRSYLAVLYKQSTGQTIWSYLVEVRMKNAKLLLLDQQLKIYEIANKVGYENSEHFSKLFKEYYGVTPKEYRRMIDMKVE